ncbi:hypothetical protein ACCD10_14580 [Pseudomonas sp. Pseusp122]|uniref:hypothetical protein n=1 Tax=unclassified Pseudomonas TaxID=196821 RepID=UPI0039A673F0
MSDLSHIDSTMPITFHARVWEQITDPEMIKLSEKMKMPNLLKCSVQMPGAVDVVIRDPAAVEQILNWLRQHQKWSVRIEETLQGLAQDAEGRPLLTAFMPISELVMLEDELNADNVCDLRETFVAWQAMGEIEGNIDGYLTQSPPPSEQ